MEVLQWKTNSDLIRLAKGLLENPDKPYQYAYDEEKDMCLYRMPNNPEARCIVGRLFYGHIPEHNSFWDHSSGIDVAWYECGLDEMFPNISVKLLARLQPRHDVAALGGNPDRRVSGATWADLETMATQADNPV